MKLFNRIFSYLWDWNFENSVPQPFQFSSMQTIIHASLMSRPITSIREGRLMQNTRYNYTLFYLMNADLQKQFFLYYKHCRWKNIIITSIIINHNKKFEITLLLHLSRNSWLHCWWTTIYSVLSINFFHVIQINRTKVTERSQMVKKMNEYIRH